MQMLTRVAIACSTTLLLAGCAKTDKAATDTAAANAAVTPAPAPAPPAPAALSPADLAGTWKMSNVPESGTDTTSTNIVLNATADSTGWTMTLPSGAKVPLHATVAGDSVVMTSDVYSSARRKGVKTMIVSTLRLQDGKLAGTTVAHYRQTAPDSVLRLRSEATKAP
jgi:hypothetical protein